MWHCRCDCGNERPVYSQSLVRGMTKSCGCIRAEAAKRRYEIAQNQRGNRISRQRKDRDSVMKEVFADPLGRLAEYAKAALKKK